MPAICVICRSSLEEGVSITPCYHLYHSACINHWLGDRKRGCPTCNNMMEKSDLHRVFLSVLDTNGEVCQQTMEDESALAEAELAKSRMKNSLLQAQLDEIEERTVYRNMYVRELEETKQRNRRHLQFLQQQNQRLTMEMEDLRRRQNDETIRLLEESFTRKVEYGKIIGARFLQEYNKSSLPSPGARPSTSTTRRYEPATPPTNPVPNAASSTTAVRSGNSRKRQYSVAELLSPPDTSESEVEERKCSKKRR